MKAEPDRVETLVRLEVPTGYHENERLDVYLTRSIANASRSKVQQGIREGRVAVNSEVIRKASLPVQAGDTIMCMILKPPPVRAMPEDIPLSIAYEDEHLIVVDKPAGMVVHPAYGNRTGTLVNALLHHVGGGVVSFEDGDDEPDDEDVGLSVVSAAPQAEGDVAVRPGIVHRLDKDTSGLLVVAKSDVVHRDLASQFAERSIRRRYLAIVRGVPDPASGRIETHIGRDPRDRKKMAVSGADRGKRAVTHYETIEPLQIASLVTYRLETGRTHQIRVHAAHTGHPVLGDTTYGGDRPIGSGAPRMHLANVLRMLQRQALHAELLGFVHPITREEVTIRSQLPGDIEAVLSLLRSEQ